MLRRFRCSSQRDGRLASKSRPSRLVRWMRGPGKWFLHLSRLLTAPALGRLCRAGGARCVEGGLSSTVRGSATAGSARLTQKWEWCGIQLPIDGCGTQDEIGKGSRPHGCHMGGNRALTTQVDVVNRKCAAKGCKKQPYMNFPGNKRGVYCETHALKGMVRCTFLVSIDTVCLCCFFRVCYFKADCALTCTLSRRPT